METEKWINFVITVFAGWAALWALFGIYALIKARMEWRNLVIIAKATWWFQAPLILLDVAFLIWMVLGSCGYAVQLATLPATVLIGGFVLIFPFSFGLLCGIQRK